jgi:predicted PurR-regulated permease PerM
MTSSPINQTNSNFFDQPNWWHKPTIWAVFLVLLYLLRAFFLIGFLTFLICFIVRGMVGFLMRRIAPNRESRSLELMLTLSIFVAICLGLYGVGRLVVPYVIAEGKSLVAQVKNMGAAGLQNSLLSNTVGAWQFRQQFGTPADQRYQAEFQKFQESGRAGEGLYQSFPKLFSSLQAEFESSYERAQVIHLESSELQGSLAQEQFEQWLEMIRVPNLYVEKSDYYNSQWEASYVAQGNTEELATLKQKPEFETIRQQQINQRILTDLKSDPVLMGELKNEWAEAQAAQQWSDFRKSSDYQDKFKSFYETRRKENPAAAPLDFDFFESLASAYPKGKKDFLGVVRQHYVSTTESLAAQEHDFEEASKSQLGQQWWGSSDAAGWIREHAKSDGGKALAALGVWLEERLAELMRVPIQVLTALMIAIFILIEWHRMKEDVIAIRQTRLRPIFDEIAPGMIALGKLIGKSFQGQAVIALFNAAMTFGALRMIGVEYKFVLALTTFVFSFIPVVGVILSGIPICAVAVFQPGGSLLMAVQVIIAIAVIHMIEGMILAPRIIGKIGHLSPVLVIAILLVSEHFFGMWGLILGVPVAIYIIRIVILNKAVPGVYDPNVSIFDDGPAVEGSQ